MAAEDVCDLLGHRWTQPEGPSTERLCVRCGRLRTWWSATRWRGATVAEQSEEIGMTRSIEQSPWEAYEALIESITQNADPADGWDSGSDIEAILYVRHLEGEVKRLRAEVERLRKVENDALWLARLACGSSWPMEMAQQVENAAERVKAAFSGSSEPAD